MHGDARRAKTGRNDNHFYYARCFPRTRKNSGRVSFSDTKSFEYWTPLAPMSCDGYGYTTCYMWVKSNIKFKPPISAILDFDLIKRINVPSIPGFAIAAYVYPEHGVGPPHVTQTLGDSENSSENRHCTH